MLLAFATDSVDVSTHLDLATQLQLGALAMLGVFFLLRPELWRRLWFTAVDPRPLGLMRIVFGFVVFATFAVLLLPQDPLPYSLARYLFTEDGLWLTDMARKRFGGEMSRAFDPEHGFEHWWSGVALLWGTKFTPLHLRSDPQFVFTLYGIMLGSIVLMILGVKTRFTTILSFILVEFIYRYSPVFYTGGDTVVRVFLFLGCFANWGQAYSVDTWLQRRDRILAGASQLPGLRKIAVWPARLMMLQLCCIYCATGLLKNGSTWAKGTALYYAMNLDHFYRFPMTQMTVVGHWVGLFPSLTILVHWWEILFPLAAVGAALNGYEQALEAGTWVHAPAWRRWLSYAVFGAGWVMVSVVFGIGAHYFVSPEKFTVLPRSQFLVAGTLATITVFALAFGLMLAFRRWMPAVYDFVRLYLLGKRLWLVIGLGMHMGILLGMNVGTFAPVMMSVYLAWMSGDEIEAFWRYLYSHPCQPGEGTRPVRGLVATWLLAPIDRAMHRKTAPPLVVVHHSDPSSVRRAALLRLWDLGGRLRFEANDDIPSETLHLRATTGTNLLRQRLTGHTATSRRDMHLGSNTSASLLTMVLPGLIWLRPFRAIPGAGMLARWVLSQKS